MADHESGELIVSVSLNLNLVLEGVVNRSYTADSAAFHISAVIAHVLIDLGVIIHLHLMSTARALHIIFLHIF